MITRWDSEKSTIDWCQTSDQIIYGILHLSSTVMDESKLANESLLNKMWAYMTELNPIEYAEMSGQ